jgi:hypothetical protein
LELNSELLRKKKSKEEMGSYRFTLLTIECIERENFPNEEDNEK